MRRLLVLVEGQTEERFIKEVLQPHLWSHQVSVEPKIVSTKRVIGGAFHKGGGDFTKIRGDITRLLNDTNAVAVTTFFDFYGFPENVPQTTPQTFKNIDALTAAIDNAIGNRKFKAYLQRHEFEAFLFADVGVTAQAASKPELAEALMRHREQFATVEDINLDPALAPSKRIASVIGRYSKPLVGAVAAKRIGIEKLCAECPRFSDWLRWVESLGACPA